MQTFGEAVIFDNQKAFFSSNKPCCLYGCNIQNMRPHLVYEKVKFALNELTFPSAPGCGLEEAARAAEQEGAGEAG